MPAADADRIVTVQAVILRADGSREDLGVIATSDPAGPGDVTLDPRAQDPTTTTEAT